MPEMTMRKPGGIIERRKNDEYEVLEIERGNWIEGIFMKPKPKVEKVHIDYSIDDEEDGRSRRRKQKEDFSDNDFDENDDDDELLDDVEEEEEEEDMNDEELKKLDGDMEEEEEDDEPDENNIQIEDIDSIPDIPDEDE